MTTHPHHHLCALGDTVDALHFNPPTHGSHPILRVIAFHKDTLPFVFEREGLGCPWVRTA